MYGISKMDEIDVNFLNRKFGCKTCSIENMNHEAWKNHFSNDKEHLRRVEEKVLKSLFCDKCEVQCKNRDQFERHCKTNTHKNPKVKLYCEICEQKYRFNKEYLNHLETNKHKNKLTGSATKIQLYCETCDQMFRFKQEFLNHLETNKHKKKLTNSQPETFECTKCEYICSIQHLWTQHCKTKKHNKNIE